MGGLAGGSTERQVLVSVKSTALVTITTTAAVVAVNAKTRPIDNSLPESVVATAKTTCLMDEIQVKPKH